MTSVNKFKLLALLFSSLAITCTAQTGNILSGEMPFGAGEQYKGLPAIGDWITNSETGIGPNVMNPSKVPPGVDPEVVNTKNLQVSYVYNENYPKVSSKYMLWYKTGAYAPNATIYDRDGADWEQQALPIGNGYLGGMLFGMPGKDHIQFNEETFWGAGYRGVQTPVASNHVNRNMSEGINGYMNAGNLFVDFHLPQNPTITNYYRDLDLNDAVAHVQYEYEGVTYRREYFASYPAEVIVVRYTANKPGALNFSVHPVSAHPGSISVENGVITIVGNLKDSEPYQGGGRASYSQKSDLEYCTIVKVLADNGVVTDQQAGVAVRGASAVTIILTSATDYDPGYFVIGPDGIVDIDAKQFKSREGVQFAISKATKRLSNVNNKSYDQLKREHILDYQKLFNRMSFQLTDSDYICPIPTDALQASFKKAIPGIRPGENIRFEPTVYNALNKYLEELHFHYARYMMIASSRKNTLPANLQGKWNQSVAEIWGSTYCININLEMNYWFAGGANLTESGTSLVGWIQSQIPPGRVTARNMYQVVPRHYSLIGNSVVFHEPSADDADDVFVMHTKQSINGQTDMTGSTNIQSPGNTAFLMYNLWDLFLTSRDKKWLAEELYPVMRKSVNFYAQYLYAHKRETSDTARYPAGYFYTTGAGRSPEQGPTQEGCKYDLQLVAGLLDYCLEASEILQTDREKAAVWREIRNHLEIPIETGADNQIKEWDQETTYNTGANERSLGDPYHRHISHLVALYPGHLINRETPEFLDGARVTLEKRGDEATGWSVANKFLLWARALDGDKALQLFRYQLAQKTYGNLFDFHAPFQIDGNFGAAAGVLELLAQSQTGIIYVLPALPALWHSGSVSGMKTKTGAEISIRWAENRAVEMTVHPAIQEEIKIGYDLADSITVSDGAASHTITNRNGIFTIPAPPSGTSLTILF